MNTTNRGRRDHFAPQGYLRGFIHPERLKEQKPLWVFDVKWRTWSERSTSAFGWKKGFYDYPIKSVPDGTADEAFLQSENEFPIALARIRSDGFDTWSADRDVLVRLAAMLSARSPVFLDQAAESIRDSLEGTPEASTLARNYALTLMRAEVHERTRRWQELHWALRFTQDPQAPVIACDQSVGMDGRVRDRSLALQDPHTTIFVPMSWDMCLFGSPARLEPSCAAFVPEDLQRLQSFVIKQARIFVVSPVPMDETSLAMNAI